jgi:hypothetical protein
MRSFVSVGIFWLLILLYLNSAVLTNGIQRETWSEVSPARNSLQRNLDYCQPLITIEDCRLEQVCIEEAVVKVCEKKVWICPASSNFENASPKEKYGLSKNASVSPLAMDVEELRSRRLRLWYTRTKWNWDDRR